MLLLVSLAKKLKTLPIIIVQTHHSAMKLNRISLLLYEWCMGTVTPNNDGGMGGKHSSDSLWEWVDVC